MAELMRESVGHVTVNEHVPTEKFSRFVDEKVKSWIGDHQSNESDMDDVDYEVAFFDEDTLGQVSCLIVVHCDGQLWRAWESGDNPRLALARSLETLAVDSVATADEAIANNTTVH